MLLATRAGFFVILRQSDGASFWHLAESFGNAAGDFDGHPGV